MPCGPREICRRPYLYHIVTYLDDIPASAIIQDRHRLAPVAMNRLDTELNRLYLGGLVFAQAAAQTLSLVDARGRVRALVMEVLQPTGWDALAAVWQGVQAQLELPAPAIAVSGTDGLQLWFSLEASVDVARAHAFLEALRSRYLAEVPAARVRLLPDPAEPGRHVPLVPKLQPSGDVWSAFVSPDLAGVFSEAPWLDVEPGEEGQSALLRGLQSIKPAAFDAALARLDGDVLDARHAPAAAVAPSPPASLGTNEPTDDPRRFLLRVMNDETVALALRIEAAKALLPHARRGD